MAFEKSQTNNEPKTEEYKPEGRLRSTEEIAMERSDKILQEDRKKVIERKKHLETEKQRTISDNKLLKGGAEYQVDKNNNAFLMPTEEQVKEARKEMNEVFEKREEVEKNKEAEHKEKITKVARRKTEKEAELLKGGARYVINKKGKRVIVLTRKQREKKRKWKTRQEKATGVWGWFKSLFR